MQRVPWWTRQDELSTQRVINKATSEHPKITLLSIPASCWAEQTQFLGKVQDIAFQGALPVPQIAFIWPIKCLEENVFLKEKRNRQKGGVNSQSVSTRL